MTEVELPPQPHPIINRPTAKAKANLFIWLPARLPGAPTGALVARIHCFKRTATGYYVVSPKTSVSISIKFWMRSGGLYPVEAPESDTDEVAGSRLCVGGRDQGGSYQKSSATSSPYASARLSRPAAFRCKVLIF